jgi:hypothetical protein
LKLATGGGHIIDEQEEATTNFASPKISIVKHSDDQILLATIDKTHGLSLKLQGLDSESDNTVFKSSQDAILFEGEDSAAKCA